MTYGIRALPWDKIDTELKTFEKMPPGCPARRQGGRALSSGDGSAPTTALRIEGTAGRKENSALSPQFAVVPMTLSDCRTRHGGATMP
ncbi:hypothetical protein, partial [Mesorhizobium sp. M5C.F.Ca.IN.020.29.1.1]|uniref:hypothetical protein n=1 Tax=Mesorhizobium sp. M5C.F.Ca.IN.020.29.1.1 TaxID=2496770 RepID=UPI0019D2C75E